MLAPRRWPGDGSRHGRMDMPYGVLAAQTSGRRRRDVSEQYEPVAAPTEGRVPQPPPPPPAAVGAGTDPAGEPVAPGLDDRERPLAPAAITSWRISAALTWIWPVLLGVVLAFVFAGSWGWVAVAGGGLVLVLTVGVLPTARYRRWCWTLTELALDLRYGIVVHQQETVPYFRIQQIDINAGPIDRLLELATLRVQTASGSGTALLPGLAADDAPAVRAELLARAAAAVGEHPGDLRDAV